MKFLSVCPFLSSALSASQTFPSAQGSEPTADCLSFRWTTQAFNPRRSEVSDSLMRQFVSAADDHISAEYMQCH